MFKYDFGFNFLLNKAMVTEKTWQTILQSHYHLSSPGFSTDVTSVPQEFLKHAISDYVVRDTDLFSLRLSNKKKMTMANTTITIWWECIKTISISLSAKKFFFWCAAEF